MEFRGVELGKSAGFVKLFGIWNPGTLFLLFALLLPLTESAATYHRAGKPKPHLPTDIVVNPRLPLDCTSHKSLLLCLISVPAVGRDRHSSMPNRGLPCIQQGRA